MQVLYAPKSQEQTWNNHTLCQLINQYTRPKPQKVAHSRIASLYPE